MIKTVGVLAHVDAGKTTFSEALLYNTKTISKKGRVDHQNSFLDTHELEKERGITIFADQAVISYHNDTYHLIDTPGHVDFSPEMERAIMIMDYAIIIISAVEGVQGHTETVWHLLRKHQVPTFFFINKIDRVGASEERVLQEIKTDLTKDVCFLHSLQDESLFEFSAERDETLLELFIEGNFNSGLWLEHIRSLIKKGKMFPCQSGSALKDDGVKEFFDNLHQLTFTNYCSDNSEFQGQVYKISHDHNGTRITHVKVINGQIKVRDEITYSSAKEVIKEKITQIRFYSGNKYLCKEYAKPGEIVALSGLSKTVAGQIIGKAVNMPSSSIQPTLKSKVLFDSSLNIKEVIRIFQQLNDEDPSLGVVWQEDLQELHIKVMGPIQLEVLQRIIANRFSLAVDFDSPQVLYKETINNDIVGYGHFEPLRHYAEVHLQISAGERNSGINFNSSCHIDELNNGYQNLIKQYILDIENRGLLTGSPLTDLKITLLTGRAQQKHTSGGDFKQATIRALRQGLEKATNILLEPYYNFRIKVSVDEIGRVMSDVQKAYGQFEPPEIANNKAIIKGRVPVATFMNYPLELMAFTGGKGMIQLVYGGYDICHNTEEVVELMRYNKDTDREYSSSSVFCAKGSGYIVPWYEAEAKMHCLRK